MPLCIHMVFLFPRSIHIFILCRDFFAFMCSYKQHTNNIHTHTHFTLFSHFLTLSNTNSKKRTAHSLFLSFSHIHTHTNTHTQTQTHTHTRALDTANAYVVRTQINEEIFFIYFKKKKNFKQNLEQLFSLLLLYCSA